MYDMVQVKHLKLQHIVNLIFKDTCLIFATLQSAYSLHQETCSHQLYVHRLKEELCFKYQVYTFKFPCANCVKGIAFTLHLYLLYSINGQRCRHNCSFNEFSASYLCASHLNFHSLEESVCLHFVLKVEALLTIHPLLII